MSKFKGRKIFVAVLITMLSFFVFGCDEKTPVEDVYFELSGEQTQIVLVAGQVLDLTDNVVVKPAYATNTKFSLISSNSQIVSVEGNKIKGIAEGSAILKVVSKDNENLEDAVNVSVKKSKTALTAPNNLRYNAIQQCFEFDTVPSAGGYIINVNNVEYDLGNTNSFAISRLANTNTVLTVKVKAYAPSYSFAYNDSQYCSMIKIYQAPEVDTIFKGGKLSFTPLVYGVKYNIYINDRLEKEASTATQFVFDFAKEFAGKDVNIGIETVVTSGTASSLNIPLNNCFNSTIKTISVSVLDICTPTIDGTILSWQNLNGVDFYNVYVDDLKRTFKIDEQVVGDIATNNVDLLSLTNIANYNSGSHEIKVVPHLSANAENVSLPKAEHKISFKRLSVPQNIKTENNTTDTTKFNGIKWDAVEHASTYGISLKYNNGVNDVNELISVANNLFDMSSYVSGTKFKVTIFANTCVVDNDLFYLQSVNSTEFSFEKKSTVDLSVEDYKLKFDAVIGDKYLIEFTDKTENKKETVTATKTDFDFDLSQYLFKAGTVELKVTHLGESANVDSAVSSTSFYQLEKATIQILNGKLTVKNNNLNNGKNATLKFDVYNTTNMTTSVISKTFENAFEFETVDSDDENYLQAGNYKAYAFVEGDGKNTFSYREEKTKLPTKHAETAFEVLSCPTLSVEDKSKSTLTIGNLKNQCNISTLSGEDLAVVKSNHNSNTYNFSINAGATLTFVAQNIGNGTSSLNSCYSGECVVTKLKTPTLSFDNQTNIISKDNIDENNAGIVAKFKSAIDADFAESGYDFASEFTGLVTGQNRFKLQTIAKEAEENCYYLNSIETELTITKVNATSNFSVVDNWLVINPTDKTFEYDMKLTIVVDGENLVFEKTTNGEDTVYKNLDYGFVLTYAYDKTTKQYKLKLLDDDFNTIIKNDTPNFDILNGFGVKVQFNVASTMQNYADSDEFDGSATELNIQKLTQTSSIKIDTNNRLVIASNKEENKFLSLIFTIDGETFEFAEVKESGANAIYLDGNNSKQKLNYTYSNGIYTINLLDNKYSPIIEAIDGQVRFDVACKFVAKSNDVSNVDSEVVSKTIVVAPKTSLTRDGTNPSYLTFDDVLNVGENGKTRYSLLVDDEFVVNLNTLNGYGAVGYADNKFSIDMNKVYENWKSLFNSINATGEHFVKVISLNNNENTLLLSSVSDDTNKIFVQQLETTQLTISKNNNNITNEGNNNVVISFVANETEYNKTYVVRVYETGKFNEAIKLTFDDNADKTISFNLEELAGYKDLSGKLCIDIAIATSGVKDDEHTTNLFTSSYSTAKEITKIETPENVFVSNNKLTFDIVQNCYDYEIYSCGISGGKIVYTKLDLNFDKKENCFDLSMFTNQTFVAIKAVANENYANSNYSNIIEVNKTSEFDIETINGDIILTVPNELCELIELEGANVGLTIKSVCGVTPSSDEDVKTTEIDFKNIDENVAKLNGNKLTIYSSQVLHYKGEVAIESEDLSFEIVVTYDEGVANSEHSSTFDLDIAKFYLNPDDKEITIYPILPVSSITKTGSADSVNSISYTKNMANKIETTEINEKYIFEIVYKQNGKTYTYYSNDEKLKFGTAPYSSYGALIDALTFNFPVGYDKNNDGDFEDEEDVKFEDGYYEIRIISVPVSTNNFYAMSKYSGKQNFTIMSAPKVSVNNGIIEWGAIDGADNYYITYTRIADESGNEVTKEDKSSTLTTTSFLLKDENAGIYKVKIKAVNTSNINYLNSKYCEEFYVYKLPTTESVYVDDGQLIVQTNQYFEKIKIDIMCGSNTVENLLIENEENKMSTISANNWKEAKESGTTLTEITKYCYDLTQLVKNLQAGIGYSIKITLIGNTVDFEDEKCLPTINSNEQTINLSLLNLEPNVNEVRTGVLTFNVLEKYKASGDFVNIGYKFGIDDNDLWNETIIYQITVKTETDNFIIYALDYDSFVKAYGSGTVNDDNAKTLSTSNDLYGYVKYKIDDTNYIYFNVYKNNQINLRDNDKLYYYKTTVQNFDATNGFVWETEENSLQFITLNDYENYQVSIKVLGGDDYINESVPTAYLTSKPCTDLKTFVRYKANVIATINGYLTFNNQQQKDEDNKIIDNPVYKLVVENQSEKFVVFAYYDKLNETKTIANKELANDTNVYSNVENGTILDKWFVKLDFDDEDNIKVDLGKLFNESEGLFNVKIKTLAGMGNGEEGAQNYLINSRGEINYSIHKFASNIFEIANGVLKLELGKFETPDIQLSKTYNIEIKQNSTSVVKFKLDKNTEGVKFVEIGGVSYLLYTLPQTINGKTIESNTEYQITAQPIVGEEFEGTNLNILNGDVSTACNFKKLKPVTDVKVDNGILTWKVDESCFNGNSLRFDKFVVTIIAEDKSASTTISAIEDVTKLENVYSYILKDNYTADVGGTNIVLDGTIPYSIKVMIVSSSIDYLNSGYCDEIDINKLTSVKNICSKNGVLTWDEVADATMYVVELIGNETFKYEVAENTIDFDEIQATESTITGADEIYLQPGNYTVRIQAIGGGKLNSQTSEVTNFVKLNAVTQNSIEIDGRKLIWDAVANAQTYKIDLTYDLEGMPTNETKTVNSAEFTLPDITKGTFKVSIVALGGDKAFKSSEVMFETTVEVPETITEITLKDGNILSWNVDTNNDDEFIISYDIESYNNGVAGTKETKTITATCAELWKDTEYQFELAEMGKHSNIKICVKRSDTIYGVATAYGEDIDLNWFNAGSGKEGNPYIITNEEQMFNIAKVATRGKYFKFNNDITLSNDEGKEYLTCSENWLIAEEFVGTIDGNSKQIKATTINSNSNFALFGKLTNSTIKNLTINSLIVQNTFANNPENVLKLSVIAGESNNSTLNAVTVYAKFIVEEAVQTVSIGGLVAKAQNTTINGCSVKGISNEFVVNKTSQNIDYCGGLVADASNLTVNNSSVEFGVQNVTFGEFGFVCGRIEGTSKVNCNVTASAQYADLNYATNIGGMFGYVKNATIEVSGTLDITFEIPATASENANVGVIAGTTENSGITIDVTNKCTGVTKDYGAQK